jgi:RNA polymerase sigma factor (sigma-70 family)
MEARLRTVATRAETADGADARALFEQLYDPLHRYVYRLTGDADAADDVAQEAFVRLLREPPPGPREPRPWLFRVATNLVRDGARSQDRRGRLLEANHDPDGAVERPDAVLERSETVAAVRRVLDTLKPRDRQILLMREEGFAYREIADVIGVDHRSVAMLMTRALRRFRAAYAESTESDGPRD